MIYIGINRKSSSSLSHQIYHALKEAVLLGTIKPGEKLPSTRELSKDLNVARNVVVESFEQLIAEGYAYTKKGSGTFICTGLQLKRVNGITPRKLTPPEKNTSKDIISFRTGIPDLAAIPMKKWAQTYHRIAFDITPSQLDYQDSFGDYELRTQISLYLNRARGAHAFPENIMITNGAAQSFSLLSQLFSKTDYALVENPLSHGILHTLGANGIKMSPINVDSQGMVTSELPDFPPKLIFTTPSHQFPTGVVLPAGRRIELIKYAQRLGSYIVEDDYDSEFRFDGSPIQSMQYLDPERVIYVGTFSKTLMPALRIGYMVLPTALCKKMKRIKFVADLHSPILEQLTLAEFLKAGHFEQHIRKMRKLYVKKRNHLVNCLKDSFGKRVQITGAETGLHLVASFDGVYFDKAMIGKIKENGIEIAPVNQHYLLLETQSQYDHSLIFGYGNMTIDEIEQGIKTLATLF